MVEQRMGNPQVRLTNVEILNRNNGRRRLVEAPHTRRRTNPRREIRSSARETHNSQEIANRFFEDEMQTARLLIEDAIVSGRYTPFTNLNGDIQADKDTTDVMLPVSKKEDTDIFQELEENPASNLSSDELTSVFEKIDGMRNDLSNYLFHAKGVKPQNSEDIISDAILRVWSYAQRGKLGFEHIEGPRLRSLMFRAINSSRVDWLRKLYGRKRKNANTKRHFEIHLSEIEPNSRDYYKLGQEDPDLEEIENEKGGECRQYVEYALPMIPEALRKPLVLNIYFNLTATEIAQVLGKNRNTVENYIYQARARLKDILATKKK